MAKKTWHIGERCKFGTAKILKIEENSITMALCHYKTSNIAVQETFTDTMDLIMWLGDAMDSYTADKILKVIKESGVKLRENSMW